MVQTFAEMKLPRRSNCSPEYTPMVDYGGGGWRGLICKKQIVHDMREVRKDT